MRTELRRFVVLGYDAPEPPADAPAWTWLAPSSAATTVRGGDLTPGPCSATDPRLAAVCVLEARDLDDVTDALRDLPGVFEVRPAEPR